MIKKNMIRENRGFILIMFVLICTLSPIVYQSSLSPIPVNFKSNIESLYYHGINKYTYTTKDKSGEIFTGRVPHKPGETNVRIFEDVALGGSMWIKYSFDSHPIYGNSNIKSEIHIRKNGDLTPSGWNHGKGRSGTITRIN